MINLENVKYYDRVLSNIYNAANTQLDLKEAAKISEISEGLIWQIAKELEGREFIMNLKGSTCREGTTLSIKNKPLVKHFLDSGGFQAELPPETPAEKLNKHFYKIVEMGQVFPYVEEPTEIHNMREVLNTYGLIDYDKDNNRYVPTKQGLALAYCNGTVNDHIMKINNPNPQPTTVNNYNAPVIDRSSLNNSPVSSSIITNNNTPAAENNKRNWWIPIVVAVITALSVIGSKLLEVAN